MHNVTGVSRRSQCSASTGYYIFIGSKMVLHTSSNENDVIVVEGVDQSQCARYCSANEVSSRLLQALRALDFALLQESSQIIFASKLIIICR